MPANEVKPHKGAGKVSRPEVDSCSYLDEFSEKTDAGQVAQDQYDALT